MKLKTLALMLLFLVAAAVLVVSLFRLLEVATRPEYTRFNYCWQEAMR